MLKRKEIRIRDPFILVDEEKQLYYMYGTTALEENSLAAKNTFFGYISKDLEHFDGPYIVFDGAEIQFWANKDFWAPEVYKYQGKYYLFGSFKADNRCRATQILTADTPLGPFVPISENPQTPMDWECLDGTLWVEKDTPYLVFCHEWLQTETGEIWAVELTSDLREPKGTPFLLFKATDNPAVDTFSSPSKEHCSITDGPFLYRAEGKIKMIWSSFSANKYAVLEAEAENIRGVWKHKPCRFEFEGGHAMLFKSLQGEWKISLHRPNTPSQERAYFLPFCK